MQFLGLGPEPRARIVGEHELDLFPNAGAQRRGARRVVGLACRLGPEIEVESLKHLRAGLAVRGACAPERLLDPPQRLLVTADQLDLELLEAAGDTLIVEDGDRVVDDLGTVGPDAFATGPETRDRHQRGTTKLRDEQFQHVVRRRAGPAVGLELEPRIASQQLQLPAPLPVLDPVSQRDAAAREPMVGRVVVRGDEETRLDRLAAELGELELACCPQLHLALERLADRHPPSVGMQAQDAARERLAEPGPTNIW